jgi:hypothetical protein
MFREARKVPRCVERVEECYRENPESGWVVGSLLSEAEEEAEKGSKTMGGS